MFWPKVSGRRKTNRPPTIEARPIMLIGNDKGVRLARIGAQRDPNLAIMELVPMAEFLIEVGYNSAVYK